jgi:hypothetical protein
MRPGSDPARNAQCLRTRIFPFPIQAFASSSCAPKKLGHCPRLLATRVRKDRWSGRRELIKTLTCEFPFGLPRDGVEALAVQALSLTSLNPVSAQRVTR